MAFEFSGKVEEAYYTNPELTTVAVIWTENGISRQCDLTVDETDERWLGLLEEVTVEEIDHQTKVFHENHRELFRRAFDDYAQRTSSDLPSKELDIYKLIIDLINFDENDDSKSEDLFKVKLAIFDNSIVKNSTDKKKKTAIRRAKTPLEALLAFSEIS